MLFKHTEFVNMCNDTIGEKMSNSFVLACIWQCNSGSWKKKCANNLKPSELGQNPREMRLKKNVKEQKCGTWNAAGLFCLAANFVARGRSAPVRFTQCKRRRCLIFVQCRHNLHILFLIFCFFSLFFFFSSSFLSLSSFSRFFFNCSKTFSFSHL